MPLYYVDMVNENKKRTIQLRAKNVKDALNKAHEEVNAKEFVYQISNETTCLYDYRNGFYKE